MFQQPNSANWVRTLINNQQIDFIVIDELTNAYKQTQKSGDYIILCTKTQEKPGQSSPTKR
jgi:hypothetical protein